MRPACHADAHRLVRFGQFSVLFLLVTFSASADSPRATLPPEQRTNGSQTLASLSSLEPLTLPCSARIESILGRAICTATIVGTDGYILTKASEVPELEKVRARLADGRTASLREVHRDVKIDLVLAQAVGITGLKAVSFDPSKGLTLGQWLCSTGDTGREPRLGIVSARRRKIPGAGAALGIRMDDKASKVARGVRIIGIASESPAEAAGLREGDVLIKIAGKVVDQFRRVHELVNTRQPGEVIEVHYLRKNKEETCRVRLASRTKVLQNWEGEDFANGGISLRSDNFPEVLQHDIPLYPTDMGGPVATLEGRVVGINIARADRVTTFALPTEAFWTETQKHIQADRHPPKAVPVE
ncbi:MAG: S1C family serine protease [Prosthecobacter sp.]